MPYIPIEKRDKYREMFDVMPPIESPGDLNYLITCLLVDYCFRHDRNYQAINDVVGALECAKQEFYRRVAIPLEETKREVNGDIY